MGCRKLWGFFAKKKHRPSKRYLHDQHSALTTPENRVRIDIQGAIFQTIRQAYTHCSSLEAAHKLVLKHIRKIGRREDSRASAREKALRAAEENVDEFAERVQTGLRIRKQLYINIKKNLTRGFYWDPEARESLIVHLENEGWTVTRSPTEADVQIAADCKAGDIVISGDSDLAIHPSVSLIWRHISGYKFLKYKLEDVMAALAISRTQLTVLGIVSHNDYNVNVRGLGCSTNFSIIKACTDIPGMVADYLANSQVIVKNKNKLDFDASIEVFAFGRQTPILRQESNLCALTVDRINDKFNNAKERLAQRRIAEAEATFVIYDSAMTDRVSRHKASQKFNRYRVIDRPSPQGKKPVINRNISRDPIELAEDSAVAKETIDCIRAIAKEANRVKRKCQGLFGAYLERINRDGVTSYDKEILKEFCPPIPQKMIENAASNTSPSYQDSTIDDDDDTSDRQVQFIGCFMRYLYSNNYPRDTGVGTVVNRFISRLEQMELHTPVRIRGSIDKKPEFTSGLLVRSASTQLAAEMKKIYWEGSVQLLEQLRTQFERDQKANTPNIRADKDKNMNTLKDADTVGDLGSAEHTADDRDTAPNRNRDKGTASNGKKDGSSRQLDSFTLSISNSLSAVENFLNLNKLAKNARRIVPMSSQEDRFLSFSERELLGLLCSRPLLQDRIRSWADHDFSTKPSVSNLQNIWLDSKEPGFLIKMLLADVGPKNLTSRQRGKAGYREAIKLHTMADIREHLDPLRQDTFDPRHYDLKGYAFRGLIRTDGYRLQLLGFKLKELQRCRFNRACRYPLPPRLTSTIGGLDYHLTEIRNVVKTPADVARIWPDCQPDAIKILCLDLGQAFVAGASALLPETARSTMLTQSTPLISSIAPTPPATSNQVFHNVAISQKAVSQPALQHRRWMERVKSIVPEGGESSFNDLECNLAPLRGKSASIIEYLEGVRRIQGPLDDSTMATICSSKDMRLMQSVPGKKNSSKLQTVC
ncbi:hypothetical protein EC991_004144 [Linnemannia zychae]|nr:hypothetical protein EC991_004144 [Linnemannia zychae]